MIRLERIRSPRNLPCRSVLWPVTALRVRVRTEDCPDLDPFQRLILDLAHSGERDPVRMACLSGLPVDLLRLLLGDALGHGWLDPKGALTSAGLDRRLEVPVEVVRLGWMLRDDLTGGAFPWFSERDISFSKAPDEACRVVDDGFSHPESMGLEADLLRAFRHARRLERGQRTGPAVGLEDDDDDEPKTMAAAEAQKAGRAHSIEILNRGGEHAEILVDLWADPQSDLEGEAIVAGCPFGREHDGLRYLRRLKNHSGSAEILSSLRGQVNAERQQVLMDQADSLLLTERDRRLSELVQGAKLPKKILDPLLEAEWGALRAIRGRARDNQALMSYRIVVEEVLRDLLPLPHERPPQVSYEDLTSALPSRWEDDTAFRALADRISSLIPADDDGARLEVPGHLRRVAVEFVHSIQGGRPHRDATHGVHLQLLPFALAAVHPEGAQGLRMKRILGCHRGFWSDLCRVIDLCNPSHHAEAGPALSDTEKVERLNVVRAALSRVLPAISTPMLSESQGVVDV